MTIQAGDKLPSVTLKIMTADGVQDADIATLFAGKKAVLFSLPGAFTPTCSKEHLPGYVARAADLKAKGIDLIACLSVNDHHVMKAWAEAHDAVGIVTMIADGSGALTKALGIELDLTKFGMGVRCQRGVFGLEDGVVKSVELEAPGKFEVSSADACLLKLG